VCSCDGILCINTTSIHECSAILWNPSIRKAKILPPLEFEWNNSHTPIYSFWYDYFIDSYKIIVVTSTCSKKGNTEVSVHTLGTNYWRRIHNIPVSGWIRESGIFVSGTINWMVFDVWNSRLTTIVSLDLEKESYQILPQPDLEGNVWTNIGMLRDCLCIFYSSNDMFFYVWIMKEYGNRESWTKLYRLPPMKNQVLYNDSPYTKVFYMFEDDQMLVDLGVVVHDYENGTSYIPNIDNFQLMDPIVYTESLISP
jgi:F-box interacting protein